jgi:NADP-dependent 3-hydroxy acid dehydrogenase YdfG
MKRTLLITGATSGIGEATARKLAGGPYRLILCGRRKQRIDQLSKELSGITEIQTLTFDVRDNKAAESAIGTLRPPFDRIDILINNAGNAHGLDPIQSGSIEDWDAMIDINVKGLLYLTRIVTPGMVARGSGHVINLGSIAGKEVYPNGNVYCASKFAVDAITRGMRMDLNPYGIKVTSINPGLVETEFSLVRFKGDKERASKAYQGMKPLTGDDIAEIIRYVLEQPDHLVLADITVFPKAQASSTVVKRG